MEELAQPAGLFATSGSTQSTDGVNNTGEGTVTSQPTLLLPIPLMEESIQLPTEENYTESLSIGETSSQSQGGDYYQFQDESKELAEFYSVDTAEKDEQGRSVKVHHCHKPNRKTDKAARNQLIVVSVLCFVFMLIEIIGKFC